MVHELGGRVEQAPAGEFGRSRLTLRDGGGSLLDGLPAEQQCWMSHRDTVYRAAAGILGARFEHRVTGGGGRGHRARALRDPVPPRGRAHAVRHRDPHPLPPRRLRLSREVVAGIGDRRAGPDDPRAGRRGARDLRALRGVDSATAALLVHRAIGDRLTCVFVDHGMMRKNEADQVVTAFREPARHPPDPRRRRRSFPRSARRGRGPRDQAQDHRRGVHPASSRRRPARSRTPASWFRAPSTRM